MNRNLILVALALFTWGVGESMFQYFQAPYLEELGASILQIGGILSAIGMAMTITHLPAGFVADRIGRRPLLLIAWVMGALSAWIMALSTALPIFVVGSILYGLTGFVMVPLNSYLTAARGNWSVGRVLTLISAFYSAGAIIGPTLGGWISDRTGLRTNYIVAATIFVISTLIIFQIQPQPVERSQHASDGSKLREFLQPSFLRYLLVVFVALFSMFLMQPLSQNFLLNERSISRLQIGWLGSARSLGMVLLSLSLGQLNAGLGFILAQAAMGGATLLLWKGNGMPWYIMGYALMGSYQTARAFATAQGAAFVKTSAMGIAYGMIETASGLAMISAPLLAGYLYEIQPTWIYSTSLVLIIGAIIFTRFVSPVRYFTLEPVQEER